jgi:hypothetical protein
MALNDAQQERYARHLLLDELGGEGQERLLSSCVRIRGTGQAARWAARYLAASGVGTLVLEDPAARSECRELSPDARILGALDLDPDLDLDLAPEPDRAAAQEEKNKFFFLASPAERGAAAALAALRHLVRP